MSVRSLFQHLRAGVHALGPAVVLRHGDRRCVEVNVLAEAAGEGVHAREVGGLDGDDPRFKCLSVASPGVMSVASGRLERARWTPTWSEPFTRRGL